MIEEILIAGFGGQGVIATGRLLAEAAMADGKQVACTASYGMEVRGGTANSNVIISDEAIVSLLVTRPTVAIVMNEPSLAEFESKLREGGLLIVNESLVSRRSQRQDITALYLPATHLALKLGNGATANVILIGALMATKPLVAMTALVSALEKMLLKQPPGILAINKQALQLGMKKVKPGAVIA